jgi:hypothetical protein
MRCLSVLCCLVIAAAALGPIFVAVFPKEDRASLTPRDPNVYYGPTIEELIEHFHQKDGGPTLEESLELDQTVSPSVSHCVQ